jgi:peptide/nickel transport system substrate-binding protein/oligopeptide transport system substrate-binding protein
VYHRTVASLWKPYVAGTWQETNVAGFSGLQWPGYSSMDESMQDFYMNNDVTKARQSPPK